MDFVRRYKRYYSTRVVEKYRGSNAAGAGYHSDDQQMIFHSCCWTKNLFFFWMLNVAGTEYDVWCWVRFWNATNENWKRENIERKPPIIPSIHSLSQHLCIVVTKTLKRQCLYKQQLYLEALQADHAFSTIQALLFVHTAVHALSTILFVKNLVRTFSVSQTALYVQTSTPFELMCLWSRHEKNTELVIINPSDHAHWTGYEVTITMT